jgi:hypothetical protein
MIKLNYHHGFPMYKNIVTDHPITVVQVGFDILVFTRIPMEFHSRTL